MTGVSLGVSTRPEEEVPRRWTAVCTLFRGGVGRLVSGEGELAIERGSDGKGV